MELKIILNIGDVDPNGFAKGLTCPKCIFYNRFKTFDEYMNSLRSNYRRRYKKAFDKSKTILVFKNLFVFKNLTPIMMFNAKYT